MKNLFFLFLVCAACLLSACDELITVDGTQTVIVKDPDPAVPVITKEVFSGYVQKGPFVNGSSITIIELDTNLNQTGKNYATSIADNSGSFEQKNIEFMSNFVQLKADGFYFNEVSGKNSSAQITLTALADVSDINTVNVNVLTHLERARVEYLVQQNSMSFAAAKQQAQQEVLAIFGFSISGTITSESLNLTENAILLAISCILQGPFSTGDMAELMADISTDIRTDGVLNNNALGTKLIDNAINISLSAVRVNLESKYAELGINVNIPDFETLVQSFIDSDLYSKTKMITYPETGSNLLGDDITSVVAGRWYSMSAEVPEGLSLKIILKNGRWGYAIPSMNWQVNDPNYGSLSQEFTVINSGQPCNVSISPNFGMDENYESYMTIEYYENGSKIPTKTKKIFVDDTASAPVCEFDDPLELPWIKRQFVDNSGNQPDNYVTTMKLYQCIYGAGKVGFIAEYSPFDCSDCDVGAKILYDCEGKFVSESGGEIELLSALLEALKVRNKVLIFERNY